MNKRVAVACEKEIELFRNIYCRRINELNELGYQGATENLNRTEKDGLEANLLLASEPYFGKSWEATVYGIREAYLKLIDSIQAKGFGLGGLVFNMELTKYERRTDTHGV